MRKVDTLQKPSLRHKEKKLYPRSYTEYIALITLIFFIGSYLNNFIILSSFQIDISYYFDTKDYITSSATTFGLLGMSIILSIVMISFEQKFNVKTSNTNKEIEKKTDLFRAILGMTTLFIILIMTGMNYIIAILVILIALLIIPIASLINKIKNKQLSEIVFFTAIFYLFICMTSIMEVNVIFEKQQEQPYFYLDKNKDIDINSKKLIKTISKYTFFYDKENEKTIVIPNSDIIKIEKNYQIIHQNILEKNIQKTKELFNNIQDYLYK